MERQPAVYIVANHRLGAIYTGVTSNLCGRIYQHKTKVADGFTKKYNINILVWFEMHENMESAITREKRLKEWQRDWKIKLIEKMNPTWQDLFDEYCGTFSQ